VEEELDKKIDQTSNFYDSEWSEVEQLFVDMDKDEE